MDNPPRNAGPVADGGICVGRASTRRRKIILLAIATILLFAYVVRFEIGLAILSMDRELRLNSGFAGKVERWLSNQPGAVVKIGRGIDIFSFSGRVERILINSPCDEAVRQTLDEVLASPSTNAAQKMEAALLMWRRCQEPSYIERLFELVRNPGSMDVAFGRTHLVQEFNDLAIQKRIDLGRNQPITMTAEEFHQIALDKSKFNRIFWKR